MNKTNSLASRVRNGWIVFGVFLVLSGGVNWLAWLSGIPLPRRLSSTTVVSVATSQLLLGAFILLAMSPWNPFVRRLPLVFEMLSWILLCLACMACLTAVFYSLFHRRLGFDFFALAQCAVAVIIFPLIALAAFKSAGYFHTQRLHAAKKDA